MKDHVLRVQPSPPVRRARDVLGDAVAAEGYLYPFKCRGWSNIYLHVEVEPGSSGHETASCRLPFERKVDLKPCQAIFQRAMTMPIELNHNTLG